MDGYKRSLMAIAYYDDFKVNCELSIGVRDAGDASHAARIVIIALKSILMIMTTLVADIVLMDGEVKW